MSDVGRGADAGGNFGQPVGPWTFSGLWDACVAAFRREWLGLSVAALVMMLILYGVSFVAGLLTGLVGELGSPTQAAILSGVGVVLLVLLQLVLQGALSLGMLRIALDVLQGQRADVGRLFSQLSRTPGYVLALIGVTAAIMLPLAVLGAAGFLVHREGLVSDDGLVLALVVTALVLMIPFAYFVIPVYFLGVEFVLQERPQILEALRTCFRAAKGHRLSMFGVALLGTALMFAGLLLCCVGVFPALGFMNLLMGGLYLELRPR